MKTISLHEAVAKFQANRAGLPSEKNARNHTKHLLSIPDAPLQTINEAQLVGVLNDRLSSGTSPSTNKTTANYINALIKEMGEAGYATCTLVPLPVTEKKSISWLTYEEEVDLFFALYPEDEKDSANSYRFNQRLDNYDLAILLSQTGARYGEIANMKWADVGIDGSGIIHVRRGGEGDAMIPMTFLACAALWDRMTRPERTDSPYVFPTKQGHHNETHWIQNAVAKSGILKKGRNITLNTFRDSRAVRWLMDGMNIVEVQTLLGHRHLTTTMKYLACLPDELRRQHTDALKTGDRRLRPGYRDLAAKLISRDGRYDICEPPFGYYPA